MAAIQGLQQAIADLKQLEKRTKEAMKKGERIIADKIAIEAITMAPGSLKSKISVTQSDGVTTIIGGDDLSAYVEFGTGDFAALYVKSLPVDIAKEAYDLFFVSGKGKGQPHPFFFPAAFKEIPNLIPAIEAELAKLNK